MILMEETTPLYSTEQATQAAITVAMLRTASDILLMSIEADERGNTESAAALQKAFTGKMEMILEYLPKAVPSG